MSLIAKGEGLKSLGERGDVELSSKMLSPCSQATVKYAASTCHFTGLAMKQMKSTD